MTRPTDNTELDPETSLVTYLQMLDAPSSSVQLPHSVTVHRWLNPTADDYRRLYNGVGSDYDWYTRNQLPNSQLEAALAGPDIHLHELRVNDETAGYCELSARYPPDVELVYFGLYPNFIGKGLGKLFLDWTVQYAWMYLSPKRLWLHTCDRDHPAALPNYERAGFAVYHRAIETRD